MLLSVGAAERVGMGSRLDPQSAAGMGSFMDPQEPRASHRADAGTAGTAVRPTLLYHSGMEATGTAPIGLPPGASAQAAGEDEAKYASSNIVVRKLIARLLAQLRHGRRSDRLAPGSTSASAKGWPWKRCGCGPARWSGVEYRSDKLTKALERLPTASGVRADAGMLPFSDGSADVVTCLEVLEHLVAPERAVGELARICRGRCVVSVPWEPFFRLGNLCRGKDVWRWGNNPEHVQHFRPSTLRLLLRRSFAEVSVQPCFPWIIAVASHPRDARVTLELQGPCSR